MRRLQPVRSTAETGALCGEKHQYGMLDGLRGCAAICVVVSHVGLIVGVQLVGHGYLAVDFFFALSGFILSHSYGRRLEDAMGVREFMLRRLIRLQPLIVVGSLLGGLSALVLNHPPTSKVIDATLLGMFTIPALGLGDVGYGLWPANPPSWSLFFEFAASLCFGTVLFRLGPVALRRLCAAALAGLIVTSVVFHGLEVGFSSARLWGGFARVAFSFLAGMLVYRAAQGSAPFPPWWLMFALFLLSLISPFHRFDAAYDVVIVAVLFPAVICAASQVSSASTVLLWLGRLSYPLYILQWPVLRLALYVKHDLALSGAATWALALAFCLTCGLMAVIGDVWVDRPIRSILDGMRTRVAGWRSATPAEIARPPMRAVG